MSEALFMRNVEEKEESMTISVHLVCGEPALLLRHEFFAGYEFTLDQAKDLRAKLNEAIAFMEDLEAASPENR